MDGSVQPTALAEASASDFLSRAGVCCASAPRPPAETVPASVSTAAANAAPHTSRETAPTTSADAVFNF
ncbi:MAG: hypothetical protein ACI89J_004096 [Hyphomicrobiaceae bacterium]|jgi:hypothetical protein